MNQNERVWQPKVLLPVLLALSCLAGCVDSARIVRSEFDEGIKTGKEFAQKDTVYIQCWRVSSDIDPSQQARSYRTTLEDLLKSESFILGFYDGYESAYGKYLDSHCSP
jgi:hypothetical protein